MERNEVSLHEVKVYLCLTQRPSAWLTNKEIAAVVGFSERTVRAHTLRFVKMGVIDHVEVFPAHRYRASSKAAKRNQSYIQRLEQAVQVFNINDGPEAA